MYNINLDKRTVCVDADTLLYSAAALQQKMTYVLIHKQTGETVKHQYVNDYKDWLKQRGESLDDYVVDKEFEITGNVEFALRSIKLALEKIIEQTGSDDYRVFVGGSGNFRMDYESKWVQYKANRVEKPLLFNEIKNALPKLFKDKVIYVDGQEVDDVVVSIMWYAFHAQAQDKVILAGVDKDLFANCFGYFYNYKQENSKIEYVSNKEMFYGFCRQLLIGDTVDNIPNVTTTKAFKEKYGFNVRGIGAQTADKLLKSVNSRKEMVELIVDIYKLCYNEWYERLKDIAFFLWLKRHPDDVFNLDTWLEKCGVKL